MNTAILSPSPEMLSIEVKDGTQRTEEYCECHVGHECGQEATKVSKLLYRGILDSLPRFHCPWSNKPAHPIAPEVLVDSNSHEKRS
jgi:hypothetical protein